MEIRFLNETDDPITVSNIYEQSWKYAYKGIIPQDFLDSIPPGRWIRHLGKEDMRHLVMCEDGRMIGTASYCRSRWERYSDYGEIVSIYFLPDYIGKGYGRKLFRRCVDELQNLGYRQILLWVLEENARARAFYEKNGFHCANEYLEDTIGGKQVREVLYTAT